MPTTTPAYDVVVVGAGPSGLTTAASLARTGVRVLVIEKHPGLSVFPKATGVRPRPMEIMRSWGLEETVQRNSQEARLTMAIRPFLSVPGTEVSMDLPSPEQLRRHSPSRLAVCPQDRLEAILAQHVLDHGGEIRFGTELFSLRQHDDGVTITVRSTGLSDSVDVETRFLVGADGATSRVRDLLGIQVDHLGSEGNHLATLFRADLSPVVSSVPNVLIALVGPGVEGVLVPTGEGTRWVYDIEWHPETGESLADWPPARMVERIQRAAGLPDLQPDIIGMFPWDFGAAVARGQRRGRAFLVGDAAHRTTPRGATGMNTGIADGHNLGWKLAWVIRGWAGESLLDSYADERATVGRANAEASLHTALGGTDATLAQDFGVRYASSAILGTEGLVGGRAPHAWVTVADRTVSTLDLFGDWLTVLTGPAAAVGPIGDHVVAFRVGHELIDPDGTFAAAYGLADDEAMMVRPDGYVAWRGPAAELSPAIRQLTGVPELVSAVNS